MNKILLSIAAAACSVVSVAAQDQAVTYNMTDLTTEQVTGEYHATEYKEDETVKAYANWQPLEKISLGDYELTFAYESGTAPALYTAKEGNPWTIRIYNGASMTVTALNGKTLSTINLISDTSSKSTVSEVSVGETGWDSTSKTVSWTNAGAAEATSTVTFTFNGTFRIKAIEFTNAAPVEKEPVKAATVAELLDVPNGDLFEFNGSLTVAYANGPDCYVYDSTGATLLYSDKSDPWAEVLPAGTVITKVSGVRNDYNTTVEFIPEMSTLTTDGTTEVVAVKCDNADAIAEAEIDTYVVMTDVEFTLDPENERYATVKFADGSEATVYNRFSSASYNPQTAFPAAGKYTIYGLRSIYKEQPQINFVKAEGDSSAIESVEAADDATAVYYNLQGVRVANPENGLFIKVQGGKSTKVVL